LAVRLLGPSAVVDEQVKPHRYIVRVDGQVVISKPTLAEVHAELHRAPPT
jgi:hypothetical protein